MVLALLWIGRMRQSWSGVHDASDDHNGLIGSAPGKRTLTDRIQRKADPSTRAVPAPEGVTRSEHNGLSCEQSFLDSILQGPVQRKTTGEAADGEVHALAAHGTSGSGSALPFLDQIQSSFGGHDVRSVQAHTDSNAGEAARGMGATAFATGNHVAFAGAPDLHTAAHEAAHVVQQRAGVHLSGGVGAEGDTYERHADRVADAVVRGESAEALLGPTGGAARGASVQRKEEDQDLDYQRNMSKHTRELDTSGNMAAEDFAEMAGEERVTVENAHGQKINESRSKFGLLPDIKMPLDHTLAEQGKLRKAVDAANAAVGGGDGRKGKERLLGFYIEDHNSLSRAALHYNTLVPLANMAARSYAKADDIGEQSGHSLERAMSATLDKKETDALSKARPAQIDKKNTVGLAGDKLNNARHAMIGASTKMAMVVRNGIIKGLEGEAQAHKDKKEEIAKKIEKITKIVGYVEQAGSFVAGAGGFANAHLPGGAEEPELPNTKPTWGDDLEKVGGGIEKAGGIAGSVVSFGLNLYYEEAIAALDRHISSINGMIAVHQAANQRDELEVVHREFKAATGHYKTAVEDYVTAITNRRELTSDIGAKADKTVDPRGKNHDASDAMLWMTAVKETQAHLNVGIDAGLDAEKTINTAAKEVGPHRNAYSQDEAVRTYHRSGPGPDKKALDQMMDLTMHWVRSANRVKGFVDEHAEGQLDPMRQDAGWSGRY